MSRDDFSDAALVVVAHGSTLNAESAAPAYQHADELRRRGIFGQVIEAFWKQEPFIWRVRRGVLAPRVFVVPLFISEGYFTEEVIPRELGLRGVNDKTFSRRQQQRNQTLFYCEPVGTHPTMTEVLIARAAEVVRSGGDTPPKRETALFVVGHGTNQNENSRKAIEQAAGLIRERGIYAEVHATFMDDEPNITQWPSLARSPNVIVVPFFISDGLHSYEDIPVLLGESSETVRTRYQSGEPTWRNPTERHGKRVWYARAIGTEPLLAAVILERVEQAASMTR